MKLKQATVRQSGQLTLPSSFRSNSIPRFLICFSFLGDLSAKMRLLGCGCHAFLMFLNWHNSLRLCHKRYLISLIKDDTRSKPSNTCISLSDFLDRKVDKTAYRAVQEKEKSFSTVTFGLVKENKEHKQEESSTHFVLSGAVFQQFKHKSIAEGCMPLSGKDEAGTVDLGSKGEGGDSRKRKNLFEVSRVRDTRSACQQRVVVLGDDPKPKQRRKGHMLISKGPKTPFNHLGGLCFQMQMEVAGGTAIWRGWTVKKLVVMTSGKEWAPLHWEDWNGTDSIKSPV
ncbi:hypothetical protein ACLOJK_011355 [Asimina triloba]